MPACYYYTKQSHRFRIAPTSIFSAPCPVMFTQNTCINRAECCYNTVGEPFRPYWSKHNYRCSKGRGRMLVSASPPPNLALRLRKEEETHNNTDNADDRLPNKTVWGGAGNANFDKPLLSTSLRNLYSFQHPGFGEYFGSNGRKLFQSLLGRSSNYFFYSSMAERLMRSYLIP